MIELWNILGKPEKVRFALALGLSALAGLFSVVLLGLSGWFLTASAVAGAAGVGYTFNHLYPSAGVRFAAFGRVLTRYAEQLIGHDATLGFSAKLRPELFAAGASSARGFSPMPADELSAIIDDVDAVEAGFLKVLAPFAALVASLVVAIGFAMAADFLSGLTVFVSSCFALPLALVWVARVLKKDSETESLLAAEARQIVSRTIENAVELDIIGRLETETGACFSALNEWSLRRIEHERVFRLFASAVRAAGLLLSNFILWRSLNGQADLALAVGAALAVLAAFDALAVSVSLLTAYNQSNVSADKLMQRLRKVDAPWNPDPADAEEIRSVFPIQLSDLAIQPAEKAAPIEIGNLEIKPRQIIQIIGPSGAGKSTFAETLMRLHPISSGEIRYNGVSASQLRIANALEHIALAPQFPAFLPGTLRDQFALVRPGVDDESIWSALEIACARNFLETLENPIDVKFGESEFPFSGGQLRRLSIARAILANPQILILDEPFAGLEEELAESLGSNLISWCDEGGKSLIVLTHEYSSSLDSELETQSIFVR